MRYYDDGAVPTWHDVLWITRQVDVEDLDEEDTEPLSPLARQCQEIWNTVQLKAVWRPMVSGETSTRVVLVYITCFFYSPLLA